LTGSQGTFIVRARHARNYYTDEKERMSQMRNSTGNILRDKDDTPVKRVAQHAEDDVIKAIMDEKGFVKGCIGNTTTPRIFTLYCLAASLEMSLDVRRLPPIAPLLSPSGDHEGPSQKEDLDQKVPAADFAHGSSDMNDKCLQDVSPVVNTPSLSHVSWQP